VLLLEAGSRWNRVEVAGATDLEGWVANNFLAPAPSAPPAASRARSGPARKVARKAAAKKTATRTR
jgi:N-acetylmuramoyl-L-alanine amidase